MIHKPEVAIVVTEGTNGHEELGYAFEQAGGNVQEVHINEFAHGDRRLRGFQAIGLPGGFSYGDRVGSGFVHGLELQTRLGDQLQEFATDRGRQIFGVCNGFQVLVRSGLLPSGKIEHLGPSSEVALTHNQNRRFYNNDVDVRVEPGTVAGCVGDGMKGRVIPLPVAHGEGRFMVAGPEVYERLRRDGQIVLRYCDARGELTDTANFNGSYESVAGITSPDGNITGMMPHPERHLDRGLPFFSAIIQRINGS